MRLCYSIISCVLFLFVGCKDTSSTINLDDTTVNDSTFTDIRDGRKYDLVKINSQVWMSENLHVSTYRNGDTIRHARTPEEWQDAANKGEGAWCYYNFDPKNGVIYGKLYNWYCVKDSRGLAPIGYHVPTDIEWTELCQYIGGDSQAGRKLKGMQLGGENIIGFNALPAGAIYIDSFKYIEESGIWWTSSENIPHTSWTRIIEKNSSKLYRMFAEQFCGFSVRCLRNKQKT